MGSLFPPGTLETQRRLEEANMPDRCTIEAMLDVARAGGGSRRVPQVLAADVPCRISANTRSTRGGDSVRADQPTDAAARTVFVPIGTIAPVGGRIIVTGTNYAGVDFTWTGRIVGSDDPGTNHVRLALACTADTPASAGGTR